MNIRSVTLGALVLVTALTAPSSWAGRSTQEAPQEITSEVIAQFKLDDTRALFGDAKLGDAFPMYTPTIEGVAYYEFEVLGKDGGVVGYIIVSTTELDRPVAEYSDGGVQPHFHRFRQLLGHTDFQIFRYGTAYVVAEDEMGNLLAEVGQQPPLLTTDLTSYSGPNEASADSFTETLTGKELDPGEYPLSYEWADSYTAFKYGYSIPYQQLTSAREGWQQFRARLQAGGGPEATTWRWVGGTKAYWGQINTATCWSGCGPTAWCNLYGWWEKAQGKNNLFAGSPDTCAHNNAVNDCIFDIVGMVGTYCIGNQGGTNPWNIYKGQQYARNKGYNIGYSWHWRNPLWSYWSEANLLRQAGNARRLTVVGYYDDWHYGTGYYYKMNNNDHYDVEVKVITGWGCNDTKWVHASGTMAVVDAWIN